LSSVDDVIQLREEGGRGRDAGGDVDSCLEIYNEELCDLFASEEQRRGTKVEIMEGKDGICCRGQVKMVVKSAEDVLTLMRKAQDW